MIRSNLQGLPLNDKRGKERESGIEVTIETMVMVYLITTHNALVKGIFAVIPEQ